jgi:hypothetical protein
VNPLSEYPQVRKAAYIFQWAVNLILGILGIVFLNTYDEMPEWFIIAGLVFNFIWSYTGLTAQQNMPSYEDVVEGDVPPPQPEGGAVNWLAVVLVLVAIILVIFILRMVGAV